MSAVEEHKPAEKRRALGRGLDSLLPAGPRMVTPTPTSATGAATARTGMSEPHGAAAVPPPIVIPAAVPEIVPPTSSVPGEIAEIHAGREKSPPKQSLDGAPAVGTHQSAGGQGDFVLRVSLGSVVEKPFHT